MIFSTKKRALTRACCECVIQALNAQLLIMRHNGCVISRECCEYSIGYAVNVSCEGSCVRDPRCVCKGCVLGTEVCFVDIVGIPVVYRP